MCVAAYQPAAIEASEAKALFHTQTPVLEASSLVTKAQRSSPSIRTSTWDDLFASDKTGVPSFIKNRDLSEISQEQVVSEPKHVEKKDERSNGSLISQIELDGFDGAGGNITSGFPDLDITENHGISAHDNLNLSHVVSDTPALSPIASSTPQPQASYSLLTEFVKTLMRPFKFLTGSKGAYKSEMGPTSMPEEKSAENQTHGEALGKNPSIPEPSGNKGSMDNAILEHTSVTFPLSGPTSRLQNSEKGLSEQEKELMPLIKLVPSVQHAEQGASRAHTASGGTSSDNDKMQSTFNGKSSFLTYMCLTETPCNLKNKTFSK